MSSDPDRPGPAELVGELARTLRSLRRELRTANGGRGGLERIVRFTSEVTIPATILVLETNVRTLRLLQRTLRVAREAEEPSGSGPKSREAAALGQSVVDRLDEALGEAQSAIENAGSDDARELLAEARELNRQLESRLEAESDTERTASVDVESELASIKDEYGRADDDEDGTGHDDSE